MLSQELIQKIDEFVAGNKLLTFLVGAGLSAESGIPTFRDANGFWTIGSKNYTPQEMGTLKLFNVRAYELWQWYLYRIGICEQAYPNQGHYSLVDFEQFFAERFWLISQNVDGLHFRAGSSEEKTLLIHGDLRFMRCSEECSTTLYPIPEQLISRPNEPLRFEEIQLLKCPKCGEDLRPHVLWFDEYYNEHYYKLDTALRVAEQTGMLVIVGTSGATTLPKHLVNAVFAHDGLVIDINPNDNAFTPQVTGAENGYHVKEKSSLALPALFELMNKLNQKYSQ
jgi:NAD-dependent deacetylase